MPSQATKHASQFTPRVMPRFPWASCIGGSQRGPAGPTRAQDVPHDPDGGFWCQDAGLYTIGAMRQAYALVLLCWPFTPRVEVGTKNAGRSQLSRRLSFAAAPLRSFGDAGGAHLLACCVLCRRAQNNRAARDALARAILSHVDSVKIVAAGRCCWPMCSL